MSFIHLRVHSAYSLAEGAITIKGLVDLCRQFRTPAVGLADSMNLFGALEFSLACAQAGIQPIVGCQTLVKDRDLQGQLILLAQTDRGYQNLLSLISQAYLTMQSGDQPVLALDDLQGSSEGLIALTGGTEGLLARCLLQNDETTPHDVCARLMDLFPSRLYIELERHGLAIENELEPQFLEIADKYDLPLVATNNVYFATPDIFEAHEALLCIADGATISQPNRRRVTPDHYFKSPEEMEALFSDIPEAIANTRVIAQRCSFMPTEQKPVLPPYYAVSGRDEREELRYQAQEGLKERMGGTVPSAYQDRLNLELDVIEMMGFPGYFLIVADFIQWSKKQGIPVGPGRGSGAGSLVAWALTITDMDPIKFQLIFERFLNPERVSLPDFDIDFCQDRRDEVIHYVCEKYGSECVAHIITFGKLQARAVLRDVGRVLEMSYSHVDRICKLIPNNPANPVTLQQALDSEPMLRQIRDEDPRNAKLIEIGMKLEGLYRHASTHAAGVVIGGTPLVERVPLYKDDRSALPVTQFSMKYVELAGLLKFDFLGLKTLTLIQKCCDLIRAKGVAFEIADIPLDDPPTYALLSRVETVGIFQVESGGMRDVLRRLRPDRFEDLIALVALYRPGPMDDIPRYLACKHGEETVTYAHPALREILEPTYGVIVYQEQVMQIAQVLGGYSLGGADILRRAMGKKIKSEMQAQKVRFVEGAIENGVDEETATQIFSVMAKFAGYGFNKSHSAPYALLSYQTAYLKANYPLEFFAASMTCEQDNIDKLMVLRQDLQRLSIPLYPPDINVSEGHFIVEGQGIRYALAAIKNVGEQAMQSLVAERRAQGPFKSLEDFASRLEGRILNKRQLEGLIAAGALDTLHPNRRQLFLGVEKILAFANFQLQSKKRKQGSLFSHVETLDDKITLPQCETWGALEQLQSEFQALGFFLSSHPLLTYQGLLKRIQYVDSLQLLEASEGAHRLAGVVITKQERTSKTGQKFAFVQCSDGAGFFEVAVFSEVFTRVREILQPGTILSLTVFVRREGESLRLTAQDVKLFEHELCDTVTNLEIHTNTNIDLPHLQQILAEAQPGKTNIQLIVPLPDLTSTRITLPQSYKLTSQLWQPLHRVKGVENIC